MYRKIKDVLKLFKSHNRDAWSLEAGQTFWFAVHKDEKPSYGKILDKTKIVPVILSVTNNWGHRWYWKSKSGKPCLNATPSFGKRIIL
ncbi:MAG: DUF1670 domain-containing protein [Candidatus Methanoperedens sp.]|nr:DUF1670 domain-containing protein [Candidatus Methanoperedens sp.]